MKLKINLPFSMWNYRLSGVYKITFEDGTFYIGCSEHLRSRASAWENIIKTGKGEPGKNIGTAVLEKAREGIPAVFEIIEMCHPKDLKDKEAFYLSENKDNELMLSSWIAGAWVPILQYNRQGIFIKKHMSISAAARYSNCKVARIQKVLSGERLTYKDMLFVYEHDYDKRRKEIVKKRSKKNYKKVQRKMGRDVLMCDENGNIIKTFKKIVDASKEVNCTPMNVTRVLNGLQKTAGGHFFKYA